MSLGVSQTNLIILVSSDHTLVDFSFYVSTTREHGLRLFDVHYKGKRILYEVCLPCLDLRWLN